MIDTYSKFYYGFEIDETNYQLDFDEGSGEITAELNIGVYSLTDFLTEIARALNDSNGALTYTASVDRDTRIITISSTASFDLLVSTGTHAGTSGYGEIGFTGADQTGASTYSADAAAGTEYSPQFQLQDYIDSESYQQASSASVNISASGLVEVVKFGTNKFVEFSLKWNTNRDLGNDPCQPIRTNLTGVDELQAFMQFIVRRQPFEFMPDEDDTSTFQTLRLEKTDFDSKGVGYKLKEQFTRNLPGFFETGILTFRVIE